MIDVMVSIAVVAVLISVLLPSLQGVQESARRVRCKAHLQQIGLAMQMYADSYSDFLPPAPVNDAMQDIDHSRFAETDGRDPEWLADTMRARTPAMVLASPPSRTSSPATDFAWQGLGLLYTGQYLSHWGVFYCPSHHGEHTSERYERTWIRGSGSLVTNYQYRIPGSTSVRFQLNPRTTIVTDGMATKLDYNHIQGSTTLKVDGSVGWFEDFDGSLFNSLPDQVTITSTGEPRKRTPAWKKIDENASRHPTKRRH